VRCVPGVVAAAAAAAAVLMMMMMVSRYTARIRIRHRQQ